MKLLEIKKVQRRRMINIDMDGVVADFDKFVQDHIGEDPDNSKDYSILWKRLVKEYPRIYSKLEKLSNADHLIKGILRLAKQHDCDVQFLTAVPRAEHFQYAKSDKRDWARRHFQQKIHVEFGPYSHDKWKHCVPGDVLIDDRKSNITQWKNAKGFAILYHNDKITQVLHKLELYLSKGETDDDSGAAIGSERK